MPDSQKSTEPMAMSPNLSINTFVVNLLEAIQAQDRLEQGLTPEQALLSQSVKDALIALNGNAKLVLALLAELVEYNKLLQKQRVSARESFLAGWQARYDDIASRLNAQEYGQLQRAMEQI